MKKHSEVADAFVNGASARNRRTRYAHIARAAIGRAVIFSQQPHAFIGVDGRLIYHRITVDELLAAYDAYKAFRQRFGLQVGAA